MNIGFILLCRYSSSRLPGKILKEINGKTILDYIIERLTSVVQKNSLVVATSDHETDNPIEAYCKENGLSCFRGSLNNVADRFLACAKAYNIDFAFRVNGDNLFGDKPCMLKAIHLAKTGRYDFISNVHKVSFPRGMSIEAVSTKKMEEHIQHFTAYEQEHVMPYFYKHENEISHQYIYNTKAPEMAGCQLAIDTEADFELAKKILQKNPKAHLNCGVVEISEMMKKL